MTQRTVEFYILYKDRGWGTANVFLVGNEAEMSTDECVELARARLQCSVDGDSSVECIGPVYWISQAEDYDDE